ncbi:PC-esterase domain-containing protein 1A, partial [Chanos chanos]|uniref:PC-esterase domain-containing protein 1A n=1 Tax=Chanos chanos TaxID=29144 RepID=A0A6J2VSM8_CHACN
FIQDTMKTVTHYHASQLLHNKFVIVIGDSIQRSVYKDLVLLLQRDGYLSLPQLKSKGELSFERDTLVEGGKLGQMSNGTEYREVRQYRSDHHLVRFYFVTRIFSRYMESVLADLEHGIKPDMVVVNSCVWDISRYNRKWVLDYRENLNKFFSQLTAVLPQECLILWNMTMPLGERILGGFLVPEIKEMAPLLRYDVIEANFYSATMAEAYGLDVLDLHFLFRFSLEHRMKDGVHWNSVAHRRITNLLLEHAAQAWGVELPNPLSTDRVQKGTQQKALKTYQGDYVQPLLWSNPPCYGGVHWNSQAHRRIPTLPLEHAAQAWGVELPNPLSTDHVRMRTQGDYVPPLLWSHPPFYEGPNRHSEQLVAHSGGFDPSFYRDRLCTQPYFTAGSLSFDSDFVHNKNNHNGGDYWSVSNQRSLAAAPTRNNYVMKTQHKHNKRSYAPYISRRHNPNYRQ